MYYYTRLIYLCRKKIQQVLQYEENSRVYSIKKNEENGKAFSSFSFFLVAEKMAEPFLPFHFLQQVLQYEENLSFFTMQKKIQQVLGFTVLQAIETSSITIHFCEGSRTAYFDLFSCKCFDQDIVINLFKEYFEGDIANQMFISRNAK